MIRTDQCYAAHNNCLEQTTYCGDGRCAGGESCSSCATDCTFTSTSDLGTQTRDCSSAYHSSYVAYYEGRPQSGFCYYPIYQVNAVTCSVYRTTQFYNSCGNPPYSTQETYEGTTTTYEKMQIGWDARYGPC